MNLRNLLGLALAMAVGAGTTGCSIPYRTASVSDAVIRGDDLVLLFYAESGVKESVLLRHGFERTKRRGALGIASCNLVTSNPSLRLVRRQDASTPLLLPQSLFRLGGTESVLLANRDGLMLMEVTDRDSREHTNLVGFRASHFWLTPDRGTVISCGTNQLPFSVDDRVLLSSLEAQQVARILCQSNKPGVISVVSDDLQLIALQETTKAATWNRLTLWDFKKGTDSRTVDIPGAPVRLEAVQRVDGKAHFLISRRLRTNGLAIVLMAGEDGKTIAEAEYVGLGPFVDRNMDRVVFLVQDASNLRIKIWYPKLSKGDVRSVESGQIFEELYVVWSKAK